MASIISSVNRSRKDAASSYDKMSRWYDFFLYSEKRFTKQGLALLKPTFGENILEIGFGTGYNLIQIAKLVGKDGLVHGIDISKGMFRKAADRILKSNLKTININCYDAIKLNHPDSTFDGIFMSFTLELFDTPDISVILKECKRVLKNGGRICITGMAKKEKETRMVSIYEWFHKKFPKYIDCRPIFIDQSLQDAGFTIEVKKEMNAWGLSIDSILARNAKSK